MSRSSIFLVVLSVVAYCAGAQPMIDVVVPSLESDDNASRVEPISPEVSAEVPALVADDSAAAVSAAGSADAGGRPKRQFGLGFLIGSALSGGYGYGRPYGYGGYGYGHGHHHHHHHGHRYPAGGYGYGR